MPERSVTVVSYAAGASLAAAALIYVFGPTFTIDHDSGSSRKKTIVGLRNQANDCFINSVLQVLAGLGDLRVYLIRETHRRHIEDPTVYQNLIQPQAGVKLEDWKLRGLQEGLVTKGLKDMLDALNERPIARKSISPIPFVKVLETAFKQRISRQQQDAQEFMQIVAERLEDEYRAGLRARDHARRRGLLPPSTAGADDDSVSADPARAGEAAEAVPREGRGAEGPPSARVEEAPGAFDPESAGFPLEGRYESQLTCQTCGYKTKPRQESFCTLTLAVPHVSSTSLNACFDGVFKTEYIDDFKCAMCRLRYAKAALERELSMSTSDTFREQAETKMNKISAMMETDPEEMAPDDFGQAPRRRISKTTRMTVFPKVLVIHLSRSIYGGQTTQKNSAKVTFPEQLPLGGLADQHQYKLVGIITHRGGHNSGHYEAFRRQNEPCPYHNTNTFQPSNVYSKTSTPASTPRIQGQAGSPAISTSDPLALTVMTNTPRPSLDSAAAAAVRSAALPGTAQAGDGPWSPGKSKAHPALARRPRKRKPGPDRWWRVSDEKVREAKTSEVLGMQREVYLLFYEVER